MGGFIQHHAGVKVAASAGHGVFERPEFDAAAVFELNKRARAGDGALDDGGILAGDALEHVGKVAVVRGIPCGWPASTQRTTLAPVDDQLGQKVGLAEAPPHACHVAHGFVRVHPVDDGLLPWVRREGVQGYGHLFSKSLALRHYM